MNGLKSRLDKNFVNDKIYLRELSRNQQKEVKREKYKENIGVTEANKRKSGGEKSLQMKMIE